MIKTGSKIQLTILDRDRQTFFARAEVVSLSSNTIGIKYVSKVNIDSKTHKMRPEYKTETFHIAKIIKMRELL